MNCRLSRNELENILQKFDSVLQTHQQQLSLHDTIDSSYSQNSISFQAQRHILSHQIDNFLKKYSNSPPTPKQKLDEVAQLLSECNLPLTNYIFMQEANFTEISRISGNNFQNILDISPSVAVTIVSQKKTYKTASVQFDSQSEQIFIEKEKCKNAVAHMIQSLQTISDDIETIAHKHQQHKEKQRKIQALLRRIHENDDF